MHISTNLQGILWMVFAGVWGSGMNAIVRHLSSDLHSFQLVFFSNIFALLFMLPWLFKNGIKPLQTTRTKLYFTRAFFEMLGFVSAFYAIMLIPLPAFTAITLSVPLFTVVLAITFLKEPSSRHTWLALILGLIGVLTITRPGAASFHYGALFALLGALCWSMCGIFIKMLTATDRPGAIVFYMFSLTALLVSPLAIHYWSAPTAEQWLWSFFFGFCFFMLQFSVSKSFSKADVVIIIPFQFMTLVFTSILAYIFFAELVELWTIIGSIIILASAVYALRYGVKKAEDVPVPPESAI